MNPLFQSFDSPSSCYIQHYSLKWIETRKPHSHLCPFHIPKHTGLQDELQSCLYSFHILELRIVLMKSLITTVSLLEPQASTKAWLTLTAKVCPLLGMPLLTAQSCTKCFKSYISKWSLINKPKKVRRVKIKGEGCTRKGPINRTTFI